MPAPMDTSLLQQLWLCPKWLLGPHRTRWQLPYVKVVWLGPAGLPLTPSIMACSPTTPPISGAGICLEPSADGPFGRLAFEKLPLLGLLCKRVEFGYGQDTQMGVSTKQLETD